MTYMGWTIEKALWRQDDRGEIIFHKGWTATNGDVVAEFVTLTDAKAWVRKQEGK
jgi:hypothetical protein